MDVRVDRTGIGYVTFDQDLVGTPPACASTRPREFSFDANFPPGKAILSLVLAAHATNKKIYAIGTGDCEEWGTVESWKLGIIKSY